MLTFSDLAIRRGVKVLFEKVSFKINRGNRVGVTGANGCGKSSLFALILKQIQSDAGDLSFPLKTIIAHVAQETPSTKRTAINYVLDGDVELRKIQQQLDTAEKNNDGTLQAECHSRLDEIDAYTAESRGSKLLLGLGFTTEQLEQPVDNFSGGWRMRLNLAQALMCRSDLLLLDEPTNHLDLDAVIWLEQWLLSYAGTMLLISHDRDFLDKVTNNIMHIEQQTAQLYSGNYSAFEKLRAERLALQQSQYEKQQREVAHIESFIRRFKAKASKAKQAQGRVKALERMEMISAAHIDSPFKFSFFKPEKLPQPLVRLDNISVGYGEIQILKGASISLLPGDRVALLGHNGAGKSTLIKCLAGELKPQQGDFEQSSELKIGYFAQHQLEQLDLQASALLHLQRIDSQLTEQQIRSYLGGFNFHGDRVLEAVAPFSGGEKARLVLALIIYQNPNLLLLDEPTNHLDLEMRHALSMALQEYDGAVVLVSHDRHLLRAVTNDFLLVDEGKVIPFNDDLDAYRNWLMQPKIITENQQSKLDESKNLTKKDQRKQLAEIRKRLGPLKNEVKMLEEKMMAIELEIEKIENELLQPGIYQDENRQHMSELTLRSGKLRSELSKLEDDWLFKSESLNELI